LEKRFGREVNDSLSLQLGAQAVHALVGALFLRGFRVQKDIWG
jgi:hypothetical protein